MLEQGSLDAGVCGLLRAGCLSTMEPRKITREVILPSYPWNPTDMGVKVTPMQRRKDRLTGALWLVQGHRSQVIEGKV